MTRFKTMQFFTRLFLVGLVGNAYASDAEDDLADFLSWCVIGGVPLIGITVYWLVHYLPDTIAKKRKHPQRDAIQALCRVSGIFGGFLWPIAFVWAHMKPVVHEVVYDPQDGSVKLHPKVKPETNQAGHD